MPDQLEDQVFRAMFRVVDGDTFTSEMADPATESFRIHSEEYQQRLNSLFLDSGLRRKFKDTEVLALDGLVCSKDPLSNILNHYSTRHVLLLSDD